MRSHTEERPFKCSTCGIGFKSNAHLVRNQLRHTGEKRHSCDLCSAKFGTSSHLRRHLETHKDREKLTCLQCNKLLLGPLALRNHVRNFHVRQRIRTHVCVFCKNAYFKLGHLNRHIKSHIEEKSFKCNFCDGMFCERFQMFEHIKQCHTNERYHKCRVCSTSFCTKAGLLSHHSKMHLNTRKKSNLCSKCPSTFITSNGLRIHYRRKHQPKSELHFQCSPCKKQFFDAAELRSHQLLLNHRHAVKLASCPFCSDGTKFYQQGYNFLHHMCQHTGFIFVHFVSPSFCTKTVLRNICLHTGERSFTFTDCNKLFTMKHVLARLT